MQTTVCASEALDDLLCRWAQWVRRIDVGRGYYRTSPGMGQHRVSRQYDDANGALDADIDHGIMRAVGAAIDDLDQWMRCTIHSYARSLVTGAAVWSSPRVPESRRLSLLDDARAELTIRFRSAGIM